MIKYLKMKKMEHNLKLKIYEATNNLLNEKKDIIDLISKLYIALKDTNTEELQDKLINEIANLSHEMSVKEHNNL